MFDAKIREDAKEVMEQVISWRRHLHQFPEISFEEVETTKYIESVLTELGGFEISHPSPTGLVALLKGGKPGNTVALRADIDALPVTEQSGVDFPSQIDGKMHACGHDSHTAMLLGVAAVLSKKKEELCGTYKLIFQAAEELLPGGAKPLVEAGVVDDCDVILGQHVMPFLPAGQIGLIPGPIMASADSLTFTVRGKGGHAAFPHLAIDPITIAAQVITNMQLLVSRERNPIDPVVVSISSLHAGTAHNIIPNEATMLGTVRTFNEETRARTAKRLEEIARLVAEAHGATIEWDYLFGYSPTINNKEVAETMISLINDTCGPNVVQTVDPMMPAEDFSAYLKRIPGCFFFLGIGNEEKGCTYDLHHPKFRLDEDALALGISVMLTGAFHFAEQAPKKD